MHVWIEIPNKTMNTRWREKAHPAQGKIYQGNTLYSETERLSVNNDSIDYGNILYLETERLY